MKNSEHSVPPCLPEDLINEILLRLPVRSLLRLKCVCKLWFSLMSDPKFGESHFDRAAPTRLLMQSISTFTVKCYSLDVDHAPLYCNSSKLVLDIPLPSPMPEFLYFVRFVSSCRGLILLTSNSFVNLKYLFEYVVWNPFTNFQKRIPGFLCNLIGFGYDSLSNDYLVVNVHTGLYFVRVEWFSFRTNSWNRTVLTGVHYLFYGRPGMFLTDALHWLVQGTDGRILIMAFDLRERKLSEILLPDELAITLKKPKTLPPRLKLMSGCLCLFVVEKGLGIISMWMMKQYKVQSYWVKSFVMTCNSDHLLSNFDPICFTSDGQVLGSSGNTLMKLTDKGELLEYYTSQLVMDGLNLEFCAYTESLHAITTSRI